MAASQPKAVVRLFEQIVFPEAIALAAGHASDEEIAAIRQIAGDYVAIIADHHPKWWDKIPPAAELERVRTAYRQIMGAIFAATHNQVFQQLAQPLLTLRNMRDWADTEDSSPEAVIALETWYIQQLVEAVAGHDPAQARVTAARLMTLPPEAVEAMRQTPVGEIVKIPVPLPKPPN